VQRIGKRGDVKACPAPRAKAPWELPLCKRGLRPFPVFVLFRPVVDGKRGRSHEAPVARISCCHPAAYGKATGARLRPGPLFFSVVYRKQGASSGSGRERDPLIAAGRLAMLAAVQGDDGVQ
jgi:hypothetical protein